MQQQLKLEPITQLQEDLTATPHLRLYLQEEVFNHQNGSIELPFNQLAGQVVTQICLTNKLMVQNARTNVSLIENGRQIHSKKRQYFELFLQNNKIIKQAIVYLHPEFRAIFEYSVIACSNLILKLSINMSKISIIVLTRLLLPPYINLFITSIIFQKFLEFQLIKNNFNNQPNERNNYVKQFPRITLIKIGVTQNAYDSYLLEASQDLFSPEACNIQFIDLYGSKNSKNDMKWNGKRSKRFQAFDLSEMFGLKPPYGMQLYLFFMEILMDKMTEFKPDLVIFIEDFPCDQVCINPKVQGLIFNEISSRVQNKIFIFKEVGPCDIEQVKRFYEGSNYLRQINSLIEVEKNINETKFGTQENKVFQWYVNQLCRMQKKTSLDISEYQAQAFRSKFRAYIRKEVLPQDKTTLAKIMKNMKIVLHDELSHLALALIQKSNFEKTQKQFRNHIFPVDFLSLMIHWMQGELQYFTKEKVFSEVSQIIKQKIKNMKGMREMSLQRESNSGRINNVPCQFYNHYSKKKDELLINDNGIKRLELTADDSYYIYYELNHILLVVVDSQKISFYVRLCNQQHFTFLRNDFYSINRSLQAKNSTLIANKEYFYKAFGLFKPPNQDKSIICRLNISDIYQLKNQSWEILDHCKGRTDSNMIRSTQLRLAVKQWGWAESIHVGTENIIVFGGGYNSRIENEEKVNRHLYVICKNSSDVLRIGKTINRLVNQAQNIKLRATNTIHPFVFGLPIYQNNMEFVVLNTNGDIENINNAKALYLTKYRIPRLNDPVQNLSIISQNKMEYSTYDIEQSIFNKNTILSYLSRSYYRINRYKGVNCFIDSEGSCRVFKYKNIKPLERDFVTVQSMDAIGQQSDSITVQFGTNQLIKR